MNKIDNLKHIIDTFPEVMWDRMPDDVSIFGWIARDDGYKDFMLIDLNSDWTLNWYITSSKSFSKVFAERLGVDHSDCKRVEDIINAPNVIRLKT